MRKVVNYLKNQTNKIVCVLGILILLFSIYAPGVAADSTFNQDDLNSIVNQTPFFDPNASTNPPATCTSSTGTTTTPGTGSFGGSLDQFLQATALHESGGNPTADSGDGAYGKYQFIPATWQSAAKALYPPAAQYATANLAPEDEQDAVAYLDNLGAYNTYGGDPFWLAINWYYPGYAAEAYPDKNSPLLNYAPPGNGGLTLLDYGNDIVSIINSGKANSITLSYNSAPSFATYLAKDGGPPKGSTTSSSSTTPTSPASSSGCTTTAASGGGSCTTGTVVQRVVQCAYQELALWTSGQLKPGTGAYEKYTEGRSEEWCADFVSWIYNQAAYPFGPADSPTNNWDISYTADFLAPPQSTGKFTVHAASPGYTPQPGDVALHSALDNPWFHTNLVVAVSGANITFIGGDQGNNHYPDNTVSTYTESISTAINSDSVVDYVSPVGGTQ